MPAGSERFWRVWFLDPEGQTAPGNALGGNYAKYLGFEEGAPESFTALDFDFDADPARLVATGRLLNAMEPDLRAFRDAGGKYLAWLAGPPWSCPIRPSNGTQASWMKWEGCRRSTRSCACS